MDPQYVFREGGRGERRMDNTQTVHKMGKSDTGEAEDKPSAEVEAVGPVVDVPPDGGYGWVVVAAVFFLNSSTWGVNSVSIFLPLVSH